MRGPNDCDNPDMDACPFLEQLHREFPKLEAEIDSLEHLLRRAREIGYEAGAEDTEEGIYEKLRSSQMDRQLEQAKRIARAHDAWFRKDRQRWGSIY